MLNKHPKFQGSCIYAVNHSCKWDSQYMIEIAEKFFWLLAGKQRLKIVDRIAFIINGVIWVDRKDKQSKSESKEKMYKLLNKDESLCIFPEGTWNLTPSKPVLPLYWGCVELAQASGKPILPICLEYKSNICFVKFGELMYVDKNANKYIIIECLKGIFASLKWEIWEKFPIESRKNIESDYWEKEKQRRLNEYKLLNYEYEMSCIREENK